MATNTLITSGPWDTAANWSLGTIPGASDDVVIPSGKFPTSGPSAAGTNINNLSITNNSGTLDLHNLYVNGDATFIGDLSGSFLAIMGGGYFGSTTTTTGNIDFSKGENYPSWQYSNFTATDSGCLVFSSMPDTFVGPNATMNVVGPASSWDSYPLSWTVGTLLIPLSSRLDLSAMNSVAPTIVIGKYLYLDLLSPASSPKWSLTILEGADGYFLGSGAAAAASSAHGNWTITDNRTGGSVSAASIAASLSSLLTASNPQLTSAQIQTAVQMAAFGKTGVTMPVNSDGSLDCVVTNYGAGMSFSEQLAGVYGATAGVDSDNNLTLLGPQPMFFLLPNGTVVSE